ncbi:hypothetical protein [Halioxenophilus sp. WMMB6]|uniref:hypothetical protein n=2 Tax=Halioxenophilus sp. WMMB6 TaxID=3073815 RepID=UPI00295F311D|nr:hypothetical protein [Halioxenophilus sp. WMMB6]
MKKLSILLIVVSLVCIGFTLYKSSLLITSYKVGWDKSGSALAQLKNDINGLSDRSMIKEVAIVVAESDARSGQYLSRYIVYFYSLLGVFALGLFAFSILLWQISNKRNQAGTNFPLALQVCPCCGRYAQGIDHE